MAYRESRRLTLSGMARDPRKQRMDNIQNRIRSQFGHASMMAQRADTLLAGTARETQLNVSIERGIRFCPSDVCRAEKGDGGNAQGSRHVTRTAIGRDEHRQSTNHRFG